MRRGEIEVMSKEELIEYLKMITDRMSPLYLGIKYDKEMLEIVEQFPERKEDLIDLCGDVIYAFKKYSELVQVVCTRIYELQVIENKKRVRDFFIEEYEYELWSPEDDRNDEFEDDGLPF